MRSIEDVLRIKKRKLDELQREINTLEAAAVIMDKEADAFEPRGIPNILANPMATQPPPKDKEEVKRWP